MLINYLDNFESVMRSKKRGKKSSRQIRSNGTSDRHAIELVDISGYQYKEQELAQLE